MKTYERQHRNLRANAGQKTVWELPSPGSMMISKFVLVQTGGASASAFEVTLYNSKRIQNRSTSSGGSEEGGDYTPSIELFKVWEPFVHTAPGLMEKFLDDAIVYCNQDGGSTNKEKKIYVEIDLPGSDETSWDLAIGGWTDVG